MAGNGVILSTRYEYQPEAILGKGAFGQVFLASVIKPRGPITGSEVELEPGTKVAIKMVPYDTATMSEKEQSRASNEVRVMRRLNHPNVVRHFDSAIWQKHLYIVMEYIDGHDLSTILETKRRAHEVIPEDQIWRWLVQICLALHNMHSRNILHRDLKPANIMVTKAGDIKVADMGLGRILTQETMAARTQCGTPLYQAPEIISGQAYDNKVDVWAIGACLYEMCFLRAPFVPRNNTQMALYRQILDKDIRFPRHITHVSEGLKNLITSMLTKAPDRRPRLDDVFQYPMMKRYLVALTPPKDQSAVVSNYDAEAHSMERENKRLKAENEKLRRDLASTRAENDALVAHVNQWKAFWAKHNHQVAASREAGSEFFDAAMMLAARRMTPVSPSSRARGSHMNAYLSNGTQN